MSFNFRHILYADIIHELLKAVSHVTVWGLVLQVLCGGPVKTRLHLCRA